MSFSILKSELDSQWKTYIKKTCNIFEPTTAYNPNPNIITIFDINKETNEVHVPIALWKEFYDSFPNVYQYDQHEVEFKGELLENDKKDQKTVMKQAIHHLNNNNSVLLALRTGFGKTFCALYLCCHFKLKAALLCFSKTLHPQWLEEAKRWCPDLKVQIVKNDKLDPNADLYIMGVIKSTHFSKKDFSRIGVVIVDEAHTTFTKTFSDSLLQFEPKYLIGLSATPDRRDGMHKLLYPFFGEKDSFIVRHEIKNFTVIKYETNFKPDVKFNYQGRLDWNNIKRSLAVDSNRQYLIASLCERFNSHKILILSDRVCECIGCKNYSNCPCIHPSSKGIYEILKEKGESVDYRAGNKGSHDESCRILIGTYKKLGVGYDSKRNLLILVSDVLDVRQNEGRIRVDNNIIIDIVDKFKTLEKHWKEREKWYIKRGATIQIEKQENHENKRLIW